MRWNWGLIIIFIGFISIVTGCGSEGQAADEQKLQSDTNETANVEEHVSKMDADLSTEDNDNVNNEETSSEQLNIEEERVIQAVYDNIMFAEEENIEAYMETVIVEEEFYEAVQASLLDLFESHELSYTISGVEIIEITETSATVNLTQETIAVEEEQEGVEFRDNSTDIIHTLEKVDGTWKIKSSVSTNTTFL